MSLIRKQRLTEKNLAAKRSNGSKGRGSVTSAGKARAATARLLHGLYSQLPNEAMLALGEDPQEFADLLRAMVEDLQPTTEFESQLVMRIARVLWRIRRNECMQEALALKRVNLRAQAEQLAMAPRLIHIHDTYEKLVALGTAIRKVDDPPSPEVLDRLIADFGEAPPPNVRRLFPLVAAFRTAMESAPAPTDDFTAAHADSVPPPVADKSALVSARETFLEALVDTAVECLTALDLAMKESDGARSEENVAAHMAPTDQKHELLMQRMEDASLRQLWRLTRMFLMVKRSGGERELEEPTPRRKRHSHR